MRPTTRDQPPRRWRYEWVGAPLLLALPMVLSLAHRESPPRPSARAMGASTAVDAGSKISDDRAAESPCWPTEIRRDPFMHADKGLAPEVPRAHADPRPNLRLGAILYGRAPAAIINGTPCREGDLVGGFRVVRIERTLVVVEAGGNTMELVP
jgi:hypothetical protein